ncbi:Protein archease [uncultured archaeon]|nr:Protein archease [uncultured archaeon]
MKKTAKKTQKKTAKKRSSPPSGEGYRFLEHTADIMVSAWGPDYLAALRQAALAMFSVLGKGKKAGEFEVEEKAGSREELVVALLSRILAECDAREVVPLGIEMGKYDEAAQGLKARVSYSNARPRDAIKAVTFHRLEVKEEKNKCSIQVVFDV